jgi:hypothetical protein
MQELGSYWFAKLNFNRYMPRRGVRPVACPVDKPWTLPSSLAAGIPREAVRRGFRNAGLHSRVAMGVRPVMATIVLNGHAWGTTADFWPQFNEQPGAFVAFQGRSAMTNSYQGPLRS